LNPDLEVAHEELAELYGKHKYLDVALDHYRHKVRLTDRHGPREGETSAAFAARRKSEQDALGRLERRVHDQKNQYNLRSRPLSGEPLRRADLALELGLPRTALDDVLLRSGVLVFGGDGARLELELLLMLGRPHAVRDKMDEPELQRSKDKLGLTSV